ncbi:hypothetical protein [Subtercola boreus]|nr:hypothetical protein [Subtercola boreus]
MSRPAIRRTHAVAGSIALLTTLTFWTSTVMSELGGYPETIVDV